MQRRCGACQARGLVAGVSAVPGPGPFPSSPVPELHTMQRRGNKRASVHACACVCGSVCVEGTGVPGCQTAVVLGEGPSGSHRLSLSLMLHVRQLCWRACAFPCRCQGHLPWKGITLQLVSSAKGAIPVLGTETLGGVSPTCTPTSSCHRAQLTRPGWTCPVRLPVGTSV